MPAQYSVTLTVVDPPLVPTSGEFTGVPENNEIVRQPDGAAIRMFAVTHDQNGDPISGNNVEVEVAITGPGEITNGPSRNLSGQWLFDVRPVPGTPAGQTFTITATATQVGG